MIALLKSYFVEQVWECFVLEKLDSDSMVDENDLNHNVGIRALVVECIPYLCLIRMLTLSHYVLGLGLKLLGRTGLSQVL